MCLNRKKTHSKTFSRHMVNLLRNLSTVSMVASINITVHLNRRNCSSKIDIRMYIYIYNFFFTAVCHYLPFEAVYIR